MSILRGWLSRWANETLRREVRDLRADLDDHRRAVRILEAERDALAEVVARDRARVAAETAVYARRRAEMEGTQHEQ